MAIEKIRYQCEECLYEQMDDFKFCPKCLHYHLIMSPSRIKDRIIDELKWLKKKQEKSNLKRLMNGMNLVLCLIV